MDCLESCGLMVEDGENVHQAYVASRENERKRLQRGCLCIFCKTQCLLIHLGHVLDLNVLCHSDLIVSFLKVGKPLKLKGRGVFVHVFTFSYLNNIIFSRKYIIIKLI